MAVRGRALRHSDAMTSPPEDDALYLEDGDRFVPTAHTGGPWSAHHQFGGAPAALVGQLLERVPTLVPMHVARLTVDLLRPVPIRPARVVVRVVREGKRVQVLEASVVVDDVEVVRASALRVRTVDLHDLTLPQGEARIGPPVVPSRTFARPRSTRPVPGIARALEYAYATEGGIFDDPTWVRLCLPVIAEEDSSPLARLAFLADCASAVGHPREADVSGINADITLNVIRYPSADWLCVIGEGWTGGDGIGLAQATLSDEAGVVAGASLVRLVERDPDGAPWR